MSTFSNRSRLLLAVITAFSVARFSFAADPQSSPGEELEYTNHLINEKSPYLLQHAHNPVDWYPWGEEAFAKAKKENKPIFLSIGYSTCHWCHIMERESYSDPEIAKIINANFVSIKVDREERPDVDNIYMTFVESEYRVRRLAIECLANAGS
jgi:thioredoxin-related protein